MKLTKAIKKDLELLNDPNISEIEKKVLTTLKKLGGVSNVMFLKIGLTTLVRVQNPHKGYLKFSQALY